MTDFFGEAPAGPKPIRRDFGARQLRMFELAGLAIMVAGLTWYVFAR